MADMVKTQNGAVGIPIDFAAKLVSGIAESRATTVIAGGGKPLLRMLKNGEWVFGPSNEEVQEGSQWAINIMSLGHGWTCWVQTAGNAKNELRGEIMVSMSEAKPLRPPPIDNTPYAEQRSFEAKCLDGADAGTEVLGKFASVGGMRAVDELLKAIQAKLSSPGGVNFPCPVVTLGHDHYEHTKWGRIFTPVIEIVGWAAMDGSLEGEQAAPVDFRPETAAPAPAPAPTPEPGKPRKAPLHAVETPAGASEPVSTVQAHVGQRRRPVAR